MKSKNIFIIKKAFIIILAILFGFVFSSIFYFFTFTTSLSVKHDSRLIWFIAISLIGTYIQEYKNIKEQDKIYDNKKGLLNIFSLVINSIIIASTTSAIVYKVPALYTLFTITPFTHTFGLFYDWFKYPIHFFIKDTTTVNDFTIPLVSMTINFAFIGFLLNKQKKAKTVKEKHKN